MRTISGLKVSCALSVLLSLLLSLLWLTALRAWPQQPVGSQDSPELNAALAGALGGDWTGVLEYRDYSEPATSTKRVKLPTWLRVTPQAGSLRFVYTYDDGPTKTVFDTELVSINLAASTWTTVTEAEPAASKPKEKPDVASIAGLPTLKSGRGVLILTGPGTENDQPVDVRTTVHIGRNILEILRETRVAGGAFTFRHAYTFVRSQPPPAKTTPAA